MTLMRPTSGSSVQVPCNHSCEAIAPVRLISIHCRRNLNGDSLMRTVDRGREWPYFDVSHCSTLQSGGSAVRPDVTASGHGRVLSAAKARPRSRREMLLSRWGMGESQGPSVQTEQSHIYRTPQSPHAEAALILNFLHLRSLHLTAFVGINDGGGDSSVRGVRLSGR